MPWEYILVDDGSTDDSLAQARALLDDHANCRLTHYPVNRGRGYALRRGFAGARGKYIISTESDLSWGEEIFRALYDRLVLDGSDIVIASVHRPGGGYENVPGSRRGLSYFGNIVMRWSFGGDLTMLSGMTRGYRREVIESLHLEANRKEIHLEIIAKARALGYRIVEIPATIRWAPPKPDQRRKRAGSLAKFIVPHLISSYNFGAAKILMSGTCVVLVLGLALIGFGTLNKLFLITPSPMPNLITYGLVLVLMAGLCALFTGLSLQISMLSKSITHVQAQLAELRHRKSDEHVRPEREGASTRGSR